ncbi:MAG: ABC transporter substrate-binding protein [Dysgonamonadaceae bacterium]|nr:ABC transporter substrate-binding protein [Dysgonamonadaceae bacterium]
MILNKLNHSHLPCLPLLRRGPGGGRTAVAFLAAWFIVCGNLSARTITDMAGRKVNVPDRITRIIPYDNKTNLLLFPVAGEKLAAKAWWARESYFRYISKEWLKLREIDTRNAEEVIKLHPDVIVVGSFLDDRATIENYVAFARKVNIPLVIVDLHLMHLDRTVDFLGNLLDRPKEAKACSDYIRSVYKGIEELVKNPAAKKRVYMANDPNGLRTAPNASLHAELFDIMQLENVAKTALDANGFALVSIEQVMMWNPEYVFCVGKGEASPYRAVLKSALWRTITAVKEKKVFFVPCNPYSWFDIPPSLNRLMGLVWFSQIFYDQPEEVTKQKVIEFYRLFYKYKLSDKEYSQLFKWS